MQDPSHRQGVLLSPRGQGSGSCDGSVAGGRVVLLENAAHWDHRRGGVEASHWEPRHRVSGSRLSTHLQPRGGGRQHTPRRSRSSGEGKRRRGGLGFQHGDMQKDAEGVDELAPLRERARGAAPPLEPGVRKDRSPERGKSRSKKRKTKKKKKEKKDKKGRQEEREKSDKRRKKGSSRCSSDHLEGVRMDGTRAKLASHKAAKALYQGTGLDPRDRVRNKVARLARRHLRKRAEKSSSSNTGTSSSGSSVDGLDKSEETIFEAASKVRVISEAYPGALANQAINQMRLTLLQEVGFEDRPNVLYPAAVAYYRQHLQRRATGPTQRELLTLAHGIDLLLRGKPASALDVVVQRFKSIEQTLTGSHWTVSQRLEILPADSTTLTAVQESASAQKEVYAEAKAKYYSAFPEGRAGKGTKGPSKGKGEGKEKAGAGVDRDKKGGKGQGNKGDVARKKD